MKYLTKALVRITPLLFGLSIGLACSSISNLSIASTTTPTYIIPAISTNTNTITVTPNSNNVPTSRILPTIPNPNRTPISTYPSSCKAGSQDCLRELLANNNHCTLPCWWGITPGATTFDEANLLLSGLDLYEDYRDDTEFGKMYSYTGLHLDEAVIMMWLYEKGTTDVIEVQILINELDKPIYKFRKLINAITPRALFTILGKPDKIEFRVGPENTGANNYLLDKAQYNPPHYAMTLYYESEKLAINYLGVANKMNGKYVVCTEEWDSKDYTYWIKIIIGSKLINDSIYQLANELAIGGSITDLSSVTTTNDEIYFEELLGSPKTCIYTK